MKEKIRRILSQRERKVVIDPRLTPAAILIPFYQSDDDYHILFTKRTQRVEYHKGEISFPGGARDEGDESLEGTALRESHEEIGLRGEDVEILGQLDDIVTRSNFVVTPFVAATPFPYDFKVSPVETEELFAIPVSTLLAPGTCRVEQRINRGETTSEYSYHYKGHVIWGATARMLRQFLDLIFEPAKVDG